MAQGNLRTRRQADRRRVVETIKQAAKIYKENLVGKTFMYVFDGRYIEVLYKAANFKHLTGVDSPLSANEFYRSAVRRQLQINQIGLPLDIRMSFAAVSFSIWEKSQTFAVSHIFVKANDAKVYGEMLFQDKNAPTMPEHVLALLDVQLREKFK